MRTNLCFNRVNQATVVILSNLSPNKYASDEELYKQDQALNDLAIELQKAVME